MLKLCANCGKPIPHGYRFCSPCKAKRYRGSAAQRGYGGQWQKLRTEFLAARPWCDMCKAEGKQVAASQVHHHVPKRLGGTDVRSNLVGLCVSCHSRVTCERDGGFGN